MTTTKSDVSIILGTAQFGMDYGVTNRQGQVPMAQVQALLNLAGESGISMLDTAMAYGQSETVIGLCLQQSLYPFDCHTKLLPLDEEKEVEPMIEASLIRLSLDRLQILYFHRSDDLFTPQGQRALQTMVRLKSQGLIGAIGVSVYYPEQALQCMELADIDVIQCPINLVDQRFLQADFQAACKRNHTRVIARSLFLQGVLLAQPDSLPAYFTPYHHVLSRVRQFCQLTSLQACMLLAHHPFVSQAVVGCCQVEELKQVLAAYQVASQHQSLLDNIHTLSCEEPSLVMPQLWSINKDCQEKR